MRKFDVVQNTRINFGTTHKYGECSKCEIRHHSKFEIRYANQSMRINKSIINFYLRVSLILCAILVRVELRLFYE